MSTNYSGNITFTNGTSITIGSSTTYSTGTTTVYGGTITIGGATIGTGTSWPSPYQYPTTTGGTTYTYPQPAYLDGYAMFPFIPEPKKGADVLVDELKSSIFSELDKCIDSIENDKELERYDELLAKAEIMHEMLDLAAEMIKERVEKLKTKATKFLVQPGEEE